MEQKHKELFDKLSLNERHTLERMKILPSLDLQSQKRLRQTVDNMRKNSKVFEEAFAISLSSIATGKESNPKTSIFNTVKEIVTHPIRAVKGEIGRAVVKKRNETPEILVYPNPILTQVAEKVKDMSEKELSEIARKLGAALRSVNYGDRLGMAAPQIGISKRIFVCQGAFCINPTFHPPKIGEIIEMVEACYSVPNKTFRTNRHKYGWAKWTSIDGTKKEFKLKGLDAVVFQHELDHLDGKCCCDVGEEIIKEDKK